MSEYTCPPISANLLYHTTATNKKVTRILFFVLMLYNDREVARLITIAGFLFLDACDPNWRSTRDGLTYSGFAASILVVIVSSSVVWFHIIWHKSE